MGILAVENAIAIMKGTKPHAIVNPEALYKLIAENPEVLLNSSRLNFNRDYARALVACDRFDQGMIVAQNSLEFAKHEQDGPSYVILLRTLASATLKLGDHQNALSIMSSRPDWTRSGDPDSVNLLEMDYELELAFIRFVCRESTREELVGVLDTQRQASQSVNAKNYEASRERLLSIFGSYPKDSELANLLVGY